MSQELQVPAEAAQPSPRAACSPTRKASGMIAEDAQQIAVVLEQAQLLSEEVPKQVPPRLQDGKKHAFAVVHFCSTNCMPCCGHATLMQHWLFPLFL